MLLDNYKKESPIVGVAGLGGGINSYIFLSSGDDSPFVISKSLRLNSGDSAYLSTTTPNITTFTYSAWIKRCSGSRDDILVSGSSTGFYLYFHTDGTIKINTNSANVFTSNGQYRDPSAWYNISFSNDGSTFKLYVNGVLDKTVSLTTQLYSGALWISRGGGSDYADYYLADVHLVDGQSLTPTSFGETDDDGVWQPKRFSGTHGTNGFHLDFKDNSSIGNDAAGSNNWTANNITASAPGLATANQGMDVVTYDGNGSSRNISGLAFAPDLVIIKSKSNNNYNHYWVDRVRGTNQNLYSNLTDSTHTADRLSSFNSDGFGLTNHDGVNSSGKSYVAWAWKAGGAASSNSNGTITSSVSASTTYGFSVVTWTGAGTGSAKTVGHSLGQVPKFIITKSRTLSDNWSCYHASLGSTKDIFLNTTGIPRSYPTWNNTDPTSSVFSVGQTGQVNESGETYVAYCWSEISGYSKFSSYTGNGNATGTIVTTGFKPRFVVVKRTDVVDNWAVFDSARSLNNDLKWNTSEAEGSAPVEFLSNGFQLKNTYGSTNANGGTYIYAAFASKPDQSAIDVLIDSPSQSVADETDTGLGGQITGNYATLNPLDRQSTNGTLSNGNLDLTWPTSNWAMFRSTIHVSSGKWYWEVTLGNNQYSIFGIIPTDYAMVTSNNYWLAQVPGAYSFYPYTGTKYDNTSSSSYASGDTSASGTVYGMALDLDAGTMTYYKNGVSMGTAFTGISGSFAPAAGLYNQSGNDSYNFGQRAFAHAAPSGYKCLTVENLATPTGPAAEPNKYFDTNVWDGDGTSNRLISTNFSPDFVWMKITSQSGQWHLLADVVRGGDKTLSTNNVNSENTRSGFVSFDSNGFRIGDGNSNPSGGQTLVGWAWDGGTSTVSNTNGNITSQVRANASSGFSIVSYTGVGGSPKSIGHGLSSAPGLVIVKRRDANADWPTYFLSHTHFNLNSNSGTSNNDAYHHGDYKPTSTLFTVGNNDAVNASGGTYIAYCFASVDNYSKVSSYYGNGSTDGTFVYTGFRPAFLLTKSYGTENWEIRDSKRNPFNRVNKALYPHATGGEDNGTVDVDFLSNGFKLRTTNGSINGSGTQYAYYAIAEAPFQLARAR